MVLRGEETHNGDAIGEIASYDLTVVPDAVLVVRTRLQVPEAKRLAIELCRAVRYRGGMTLWLSKKAPPSGLKTEFDVVLLGDYIDFAL